MAAYFFDSSALAKRFIRETGTALVLNLWRPSAGHAIYAARLTEVEVCAALARRHKSLKLTSDQFHKSVKRLRRDFAERLVVTATTESIVIDALRLAESYALRGYDALQLASALEANRRRLLHPLPPLTLVSSDSDLNQAAQAEGLTVEDPNNH